MDILAEGPEGIYGYASTLSATTLALARRKKQKPLLMASMVPVPLYYEGDQSSRVESEGYPPR
jgi:hypothetical protein